ncbi:MAG: hypothetical protein EOM87_03665, partial [Clostridia bacterium]|nr:hypothetical protein [Clostridia bacterium]
MKKVLLIILLIAVSLTAFVACQSDIITYKNSGTIVINIVNEDLAASVVTIRSTDDSDDIVKTGSIITITKTNMLRSVYTLTVNGYIAKTVIVNSTDFDAAKSYSVDVEFSENYVFMVLEVVTEANYSAVNLTGSDIISYTETRGNYDIKIKAVENASVTISAGSAYRSYTISLTQDDVLSGSIAKTAMLILKTQTLIVIDIGANKSIQFDTDSNNKVISHKQGNYFYYAVSKSYEINFRYYDIADYQYSYFGERLVTVGELAADRIELDDNDIVKDVTYTVTPYNDGSIFGARIYLLAQKDGDNYTALQYNNGYYTTKNYKFSSAEEYSIFTICGDGKVRRKSVDLTQAIKSYGSLQLAVTFDGTEPEVPIAVKIVDITGGEEDFAGVSVYANNNMGVEYLGQISSDNQCVVNPSNHFSDFYCQNIPSNYYLVDVPKNQEFY